VSPAFRQGARGGRGWAGWVAAALAGGAALAGLPLVVGEYGLGLLSEMLAFAVFAMSLDLLLGFAGLSSLGHAAFFGLGGYTVGLLARHGGFESVAGLGVAVLAAVLVAAVFAPLVLRASGAYFLMLTLALGQLLYGMAWLWRPVTGGDDGLSGIPRPQLPFWGGLLYDDRAFYYFALAVAGLAAASMVWIVRSSFGLALRGIRDNEARMTSLGYHGWLYKYAVYVLAAGYAALGGALYAYYFGYISPHHLGWALSGEAMVMVILGGAGTLWGPVLGAVLVILLRYEVSSYTERWLTVLGLVFVLVVLFAPQGVAGMLRRFSARLGRLGRAGLQAQQAGSEAAVVAATLPPPLQAAPGRKRAGW